MAQSFQRFIDGLFRDLPYMYAYIDDILVVSASPEGHNERVKEVLRRLHAVRIVVNVAKCQFHQEAIDFLGYCASPYGIQPDPKRVKPVVEYELPKEGKGLRNGQFLQKKHPTCCRYIETPASIDYLK